MHCTPLEARRELDDDPDQLVLLIMELRAYRAAFNDFHRAFDHGNIVRDLAHWKGSPMMSLVEDHVMELADAEEVHRG